MTRPTRAGGTLDLRSLPPPQRHPLVFRSFESLSPGESFTLINDHDPKPLYYQFRYEREGQFTWEYLEEGPERWKVKLGRAAAAGEKRELIDLAPSAGG